LQKLKTSPQEYKLHLSRKQYHSYGGWGGN